MNKVFLSLLMIVFCAHLGYAQKRQAWVNAADTAYYVEKDYYKAFKYYETALLYKKRKNNFPDVDRLTYQKAESARNFNAYFDAKEAYLELINKANEDPTIKSTYPCAWAYVGDMYLSLAYSGGSMLSQAYYDTAALYFREYKQLEEDFPASTGTCSEVVDKGLETIAFVKGLGTSLSNETIEVKSETAAGVNSRFSDFAPLFHNNTLYFTSYRNEVWEKGVKPSRYFSKIFKSENGAAAVPLEEAINLPMDTNVHVGHTAFSLDGSRMYFTVCEFQENTLDIRCDLFYHNLDNQGKPTGDAISISALNNFNVTTTQPAIGWDESRQREVLYFVSDRAGSRGMDIWRSDIVNGEFQTPTNQLSINTEEDDITPYYHRATNQFYFSSRGHAKKYGGYDIFTTSDPVNGTINNLGLRVNSSGDEVYFSLDGSGRKAYFASNRLATTSFETMEDKPDELKEACCLDIYTYEPPPPCDLVVSTFTRCNCETPQELLVDVKVELFDITESYQGVLIPGGIFDGTATTYSAVLMPNRKYLVKATKEGYSENSYELDFTNGRAPCNGGPEKASLCLECAAPFLEARVYNEETGDEIRDATVRIVDISSGWETPIQSQYRYGQQQPLIACPEGFFDFSQPIIGQVSIDAFSQNEIAFRKDLSRHRFQERVYF